jgi:preprotein translocase subunit Sss1
MSKLNDKICINKQNSVNFGVNILTHCTFLLAIICSVFFLFTEKIMSDAINNQIEDLAVDTLDKFYSTATPKNQEAIKLSLQHAQLETILKIYQTPTEDRYINNAWIEKLIYVIVGLLIFVVIVAIIISKAHCGNISIVEIFSENIVIFMFIGIVEFLFFTKIIIKYIPAYPSTLSNIFVEQLKEYKPPN